MAPEVLGASDAEAAGSMVRTVAHSQRGAHIGQPANGVARQLSLQTFYGDHRGGIDGERSAVSDRVDYDAIPCLGDIARYHARHRAGRIAISFEHRETSWGDLDRASNRVANALTASGCQLSDRIAFIGRHGGGIDQHLALLVRRELLEEPRDLEERKIAQESLG